MNQPDELLLIGVIVAAFGLHGQVKAHAITDRPEHIARRVRTVYVGRDYTPYRLLHVHLHKPGVVLLKLEGVHDRDTAEALRRSEVYIREEDAAPLEAGEYYIHDLYDLYVDTVAGERIGQVREVLETGANEVLVVTRPDQPDVLIPMIREIVQELDFEGKRIIIQPMEGLF
ncbi:MAG: 16S rRNA processing protein RimM [Chloroflexaceae bacterium]|nr:16S rRNA processing protein RimM [Chloroflexaceae bacterium]NJO06939.1 16S rRNA processing protein RimM [Chloroflexaceae bacterium]